VSFVYRAVPFFDRRYFDRITKTQMRSEYFSPECFGGKYKPLKKHNSRRIISYKWHNDHLNICDKATMICFSSGVICLPGGAIF
jgi:hypothetical protein